METKERSFTAQTKCGNLSSCSTARGQNHPACAGPKTIFPTGQISGNRTKSGPQKVKTGQNPICHRMTVVDGGYHLNTLFRGVKKDIYIMHGRSTKTVDRRSAGAALINTGFQLFQPGEAGRRQEPDRFPTVSRTAQDRAENYDDRFIVAGDERKSGGSYSLRTAHIQAAYSLCTGHVQVKTGLIQVNTAKYR